MYVCVYTFKDDSITSLDNFFSFTFSIRSILSSTILSRGRKLCDSNGKKYLE